MNSSRYMGWGRLIIERRRQIYIALDFLIKERNEGTEYFHFG